MAGKQPCTGRHRVFSLAPWRAGPASDSFWMQGQTDPEAGSFHTHSKLCVAECGMMSSSSVFPSNLARRSWDVAGRRRPVVAGRVYFSFWVMVGKRKERHPGLFLVIITGSISVVVRAFLVSLRLPPLLLSRLPHVESGQNIP
jgi:hypothetical protein